MKTAWSPEMFATPFSEMGEFFSEYPACTSFYSFGNVTQGVLRRVFKEYMNMIGIYSNLDNLNIHFFTCLADYTLGDHCHIANQHLSSVFWGRKQDDRS